MKKTLAFVVALASLAVGALAQKDIEISKVQPSMISTPDYTFQGDQRRTGKAEKWLEVEVEFSSKAEMIEELTFNYYILFAGKCLTGSVTHVSIMKGRDLHSVMYVAPRTLAQLLEGKSMTANAIEDVGIQVSRQGQVVATKSFKASGEAMWWQSKQQKTGLVLNKNETPFAPLYWDRYEAIKANRN